MIINTKQHLSDKADSFVFDKIGTVWEKDPTVNTLQDVYDDMHPYSLNGYPLATTNTFGIVMLATDKDLEDDGNDNVMTNKFLLESMDKPRATYSNYGLVRLSTTLDYTNGVDESAITNKTIQYARKRELANKTKYGTVIFATDEEVIAGTNDTKAITPNQLRLGISKLHTPTGIATETVYGTVRISYPNDNYNGIVHNGFAISPNSIKKTRANTKKYGLVKFATKNEYNEGAPEVSVTPLMMKIDIEKINSTVSELDSIKENHNKFVGDRPSIIKGVVDRLWGEFSEADLLNDLIPIGTIQYSYNKSSGVYMVETDGRSLNKNTYPQLFGVIGYRFGGSGNNFNIPDTRGLFVKMYGKSSNINKHPLGKFYVSTNIYDFQDDRMGKHRHAGWNGGDGQAYHGHTRSADWYGDDSGDWDNSWGYTSDGANLGGDNSLDPNFLIDNETRPWNMPIIMYIRIK